jgi:hypothetical protein
MRLSGKMEKNIRKNAENVRGPQVKNPCFRRTAHAMGNQFSVNN